MKIVINAYSARQGGGQTYLINLLDHLPLHGAPQIEVFAPASLTLPEHPNIQRVHANWPTENPLLRAVWERWILPGYLKQTGADVLFCPGGLVATRAPKGCRVVTMFRNMLPFDPIAMRAVPLGLQWLRLHMLRRLMLKSMRDADLTIFISVFARKVIEKLVPIPNSVIVPHGISEVFRASAQDLPRPIAVGDKPYLLYVSKLDNYKHHYEVVTAFSMLPDYLRCSYQLVLIGENEGQPAERIKVLIRKLGLDGQVLLLGAVPYNQLPAFYLNSKANIFASSCENCPNIMLEALASGRPLISSDVEPMPEFGGCDIGYFSPFDPESICGTMRAVLEDATLAEKWAFGALRQGRIYNWSETASSTWNAIFRLKSIS